MYSFCDIETYELLTGTDVPTQEEPHIQALLDLNSDLVGMSMGTACAARVMAEYPDVLAGLVAYRTYRGQTIPAGVQSESVGSSSVSYLTGDGSTPMQLAATERDLIARLCGRISYGKGIGSVSFAGAAFVNTDAPAVMIERIALAQGWPTVWLGWALTNRAEFYGDS